jgi:acyl carrier protein
MTDLDIVRETRAYVVENFLYMRPDFIPADDDSLLAQGIIDSLGVMELVQFLEQEFGVKVDEDEITEDHIGTLAAISRYVSSKLPPSSAPAFAFIF